MSLHEKTSWFNLVVLMLTLIFYTIFFMRSDITINLGTSLAIFFIVSLIGILCNFAVIIFYKRSMDPAVSLNEPDPGTQEESGVYPYVFYWGTFAGILTWTFLWLSGISIGLISEKASILIMHFSILIGVLFTVFLHKYKKMKGDSLENINNYSARDIAMQKVLIGYDERDLHIRKTARSMSLMITSSALFLGSLIIILWTKNHSETFMLHINLISFLVVTAVIMFFRHIVIQTATIIQYRMGR